MSREVAVVLEGFTFLESPRWHDDRIWVSDFYSGRVVSAHADGSYMRVEAEVKEQPSGLGWLPDGRLLVVSMRDSKLMVRDGDGALSVHADLGPFVGGHANDMVVDDRGRAFVGNLGFDPAAGAPIRSTALVRVDPDGVVAVVADELRLPNGSVITPEGVLIVAETVGGRLTAFDIGDDGSLSNRRVWAKFGDVPTSTDLGGAFDQLAIAPDGICLDAEGAMWVADASHGRLVRVLEGGEIIDEVHAGLRAYACMLGGAAGTTLFICARPSFDEQPRIDAAEARLLSVQVDVPHSGCP